MDLNKLRNALKPFIELYYKLEKTERDDYEKIPSVDNSSKPWSERPGAFRLVDFETTREESISFTLGLIRRVHACAWRIVDETLSIEVFIALRELHPLIDFINALEDENNLSATTWKNAPHTKPIWATRLRSTCDDRVYASITIGDLRLLRETLAEDH